MKFKQIKINKTTIAENEEYVIVELTFLDQERVKKIAQLGIQGYPGMTFGLNEEKPSILLGSTGLLDLDLNLMPLDVSFIYFPQETISIIKNNPSLYILIDVIYEGSE